MKRPQNETTALKLKARELILVERVTKKSAAATLGVTEKTMGKWCREMGFNEVVKTLVPGTGEANSLLRFVIYVRVSHPDKFAQVEALFNDYLSKF
jgi:transposase-like protein